MNLPETMRTIDPATPGGAGVLRVTTRPVPRPQAGEVLIRVHACGLNRADILQRQGLYPVPEGAPTIPGLEVAGEIVAIGAGVADGALRPGDHVAALVQGGGYAEYAVAAAPLALPIPKGLTFAEAATLPESWFTVWLNLHVLAGARPGETILVHGGTSGIGCAAIDYGRLFGLPVLVTCGSAAKCAAARAMGASLAVNHRDEDFVAAIPRALADAGKGTHPVDIVLDMVGGDYVARNLALLGRGGRHVSIAYMGGRRATIDLSPVMARGLRLTGSLLRPRSVAEKAAIAADLRRHVWPALAARTIRPHLFHSFPLEQAAAAHRLMEEGGHIGKLALVVQKDDD